MMVHPHMTYENLPPPHLFALLSPLYIVTTQGTIHSFLLPPVSPGKLLRQAIHLMLPIQTNTPLSQHTLFKIQ